MHKEHFDASVLEIFPKFILLICYKRFKIFMQSLINFLKLPLIFGGAELTRPA